MAVRSVRGKVRTMATITAAMVKELREISGAGMMDCKNALTENDGNMEAAVDWLRAKGITKAEKKSGRTAAEGLIGIASVQPQGCGRRSQLRDRLCCPQRCVPGHRPQCRQRCADNRWFDRSCRCRDLSRHRPSLSLTRSRMLSARSAKTCRFRRSAMLTVKDGVVATYVHNAVVNDVLRQDGRARCHRNHRRP